MENSEFKNRWYLFTLDYGKRVEEKKFIKDVLERYDSSKLIGTAIWTDNNPYCFKFYFYANFVGDTNEFENWLKLNYPEKERKYNYFMDDSLKSLNTTWGIDVDSLDFSITHGESINFLFAGKLIYNQYYKGGLIPRKKSIFLSHSSLDKSIVDKVYKKLKAVEIDCWYDKYEIKKGDNVFDKIEEGLSKSQLGILFVSKNFFTCNTNWTKIEMDYFINRNILNKKSNFICLNIDLGIDELPALLQQYKYFEYLKDDIERLIKTIKKRMSEV